MRRLFFALLIASAAPAAATPTPTVTESDVILRDFRFANGQSLDALKIHYRTLGVPHRNQAGDIDNAVMIIHASSSSGAQFLGAGFAEPLFQTGGALDVEKYFIILPDAIGHGQSAKPSDGLRAHFPNYDYADMVEAQRRMLREGLGIRHLRLIIGTSMGCMHAFLWGETHGDAVDALMPIACLPMPVAGQNRVWRRAVIDGIKADPAWQGGDYTVQPALGLRTAISLLSIAGGIGPLAMQRDYPTRETADAFFAARMARDLATLDANDLLYQIDASRTYDPEPDLDRIVTPLLWVNIGDDFINLPGSPAVAAAAARLKTGRFVMIPASPQTRGHSTHSIARFWQAELRTLLDSAR